MFQEPDILSESGEQRVQEYDMNQTFISVALNYLKKHFNILKKQKSQNLLDVS